MLFMFFKAVLCVFKLILHKHRIVVGVAHF